MKQISTLVLRRKLGKIIDRVAKKHESIIISRANKPLVVITAYDVFAPQQAQEERRQRLQKVAQEMEEWAKRNAEALKGSDVVKEIREMRDSRYGPDTP